jgi:CspA family cold shock protein
VQFSTAASRVYRYDWGFVANQRAHIKEIDMSMNGTIKRLVSDKGFGFIAAGDGTEYFFHQSACTGTAFDQLREGQAVTFDVGHGAKGPRGENVKLA